MNARPQVKREPSPPPRDAKRKQIKIEPRRPIAWDRQWTYKQRADVFRAWHACLMKQLSQAKLGYRMAALVWRFIDYRNAVVRAPSKTLVATGGKCDQKTIEHDIDRIEALGFFIRNHDLIKDEEGNERPCRLLRLAIPDAIRWSHGWGIEEDIAWGHVDPRLWGARGPTSYRTDVEEEERGVAE